MQHFAVYYSALNKKWNLDYAYIRESSTPLHHFARINRQWHIKCQVIELMRLGDGIKSFDTEGDAVIFSLDNFKQAPQRYTPIKYLNEFIWTKTDTKDCPGDNMRDAKYDMRFRFSNPVHNGFDIFTPYAEKLTNTEVL